MVLEPYVDTTPKGARYKSAGYFEVELEPSFYRFEAVGAARIGGNKTAAGRSKRLAGEEVERCRHFAQNLGRERIVDLSRYTHADPDEALADEIDIVLGHNHPDDIS